MSLNWKSALEIPVEKHAEHVQRPASQQSSELEQAVKTRIRQWTAGQVHALEVRMIDQRIVINGSVGSYYLKQLALQGTLEAIHYDDMVHIECNISVFSSQSCRVTAMSSLAE